MMTLAPETGRWAVLLGLILLGAWMTTEWILLPWAVAGDSMLPTLQPGDRVLVDRWTYRNRLPRAGEIALLVGPGRVPLVKRVSHRIGAETRFWVLGDHLAASTDSRDFGPLPSSAFRGRVLWRYWPLSRAGPVR